MSEDARYLINKNGDEHGLVADARRRMAALK